MPRIIRKKLGTITVVYWVLLLYIIAALVWWFFSLVQQNKMMTDFEINKLNYTIDRHAEPEQYKMALEKVNRVQQRNDIKYISEGVIFFLVILAGAAFVYRAVKKEFNVQQQQQNFLMAVTHELKTPISVTRLNLETIQKYSLDSEKQQRIILMTLQETARLDFLTNNILVSSQLEGSGFQSAKEEMNLSDLIMDCLQEFGSRYPQKKFIEHIEPNMDVKGDALLLKILVSNLLENAVKYAPKETYITIRLGKEGRKIKLEVLDEGPGIPDEEKKKIFQKFYRIGNEAIRKTPGSGLGLFLCRKIVEDHNADITVTNNPPGGSNFIVTFYH